MDSPKRHRALSDYFSEFWANHELVLFGLTVAAVSLVFYLLAVHIPALIVGILLAYLLEGVVSQLERYRCPRTMAISGSLLLSILGIAALMLFGLPKLTQQVGAFARQIPILISRMENSFKELPSWAEPFIDSKDLATHTSEYLKTAAEGLLSSTFTNVGGLFSLVVYTVLMPLLIFFLLRDKRIIINWFNKYIPNTRMIHSLKSELDEQFGAYVRGKIIEGSIIFLLSLFAFLLLNLNYSFTMAVAVGLSVIIPFVGAVLVTFPLVIIGMLQFGFSAEFWWLIGLYTVIQTLDGQLIVPLLFSEVVKIHPVAILIAILFFGAVWGVWGVFFAIPLAALIKSVINVIEKQQIA